MTPIRGRENAFVRLILVISGASHVGNAREALPLNDWASGIVCQNRCLILTDSLQSIRQRSDLLCEVESFGKSRHLATDMLDRSMLRLAHFL